LRGSFARFAGWVHWDVIALLAGAIPLLILLAGVYLRYNFGGYGVAIMVAAVLLHVCGAAFAWRRGDGRMIASGCALLMIALILMLPVIIGTAFLLAACLMGNCI
jgi:hypothetical protein